MRKIIGLLVIFVIVSGCSTPPIGKMSWTFQNATVKDDILGIFFRDVAHGWAVTSAGDLLRTSDGGKNWTASRVCGERLKAVAAIDKKTVWIAGDKGSLYSSTDAGVTFSNRSLDSNLNFASLIFWDKNEGVLVGNRRDDQGAVTGAVFRTANGGAEWNEIYMAIDSITSLAILKPFSGWIGTAGNIWTTKDKGVNWEKNYLGVALTVNAMYFNIRLEGFLIGDSGTFYTSNDGGWSWNKRGGAFPNRKLNSIEFFDIFRGVIVGAGGLIMISTNAGDSWSFDEKFTKADLFDIAIVNNRMWICGASGTIIAVQ